MGQYLVVANQTLGGAKLDRIIRDRIERGDSKFFIVVPMTAPKHEADAWSRGFSVYEGMSRSQMEQARMAVEEDARRLEALFAEARRRAEHRMEQMIDKIQSAGGEADGTVGDADPAVAVKDVLQNQSFDEVILSTLPSGISRWIKMDLPNRVARMTEARVITVEAED